MSISGVIKRHVADGTLVQFCPPFPSIEVRRGLFLAGEASKSFEDGYFDDQEDERRFGQVVADLQHFVEGGQITFGMDPENKSSCAMMARVLPIDRGIICMRLREPRPSVRIFGGFIDQDCFVATRWAWRSNLGGIRDPRWMREIENAYALWISLFPEHRPLIRGTVSGYIRENATAV